jgi:hypothetical protein
VFVFLGARGGPGGRGAGGVSNYFLFVCGNIAAEKGELLTKVGS